MDRVVDKVDNVYRLRVLGDLKGWVRNRMMAGITGEFEVLGESDSGRRVMDSCAERGLCVGKCILREANMEWR